MTGFFYAGPHCWVTGLEQARDLRTIENAIETAREEDFGRMEVVAGFDDPECELVLALERNEPAPRYSSGQITYSNTSASRGMTVNPGQNP
jgi:hypothetical protein